MRVCLVIVICLMIPENISSLIDELHSSRQESNGYLKFPDGFILGAGGSAYQIEGGWNASGKGESVWDRFVHSQPWKIYDRSNADTSCDAFHKYKDDVHWVKAIGLDHYRFSIGWSRVLPNGFSSSISQEGLRYYHNLIDELLANDIQPAVLLYHWDHPQVLEDMGGWLNESMVDRFADYADVIFRELGPKVKIFSTVNEPRQFCSLSYVRGNHAPGKTMNLSAEHLCLHNILKAHARAYHLYDEKYRSTQNGRIGIVENCASWYGKNSNNTLAAEIGFQSSCGATFHPIFIGDYPAIVKCQLAKISRDAGLPDSSLKFSPEWIEYIRGTFDYLGLNHYFTFLAEFVPSNDTVLNDCMPGVGMKSSYDPSWEEASAVGHNMPQSFGDLLRKIKVEYNNPLVYITENGMSADKETLNDYRRANYHYSYLKELLLAVHRDGCHVRMYTIWSLMDNFEWDCGYSAGTFGLIFVNFSTPNLERSPKLSAAWLRNVTRTRELQQPILAPFSFSNDVSSGDDGEDE